MSSIAETVMMRTVFFDHVTITRGDERVECSADEFLRMPLFERAGYILKKDVQFFRGSAQVDRDQALATLRALSADLNRTKVLALTEEEGFEQSVKAMEKAGYQVLVVTLLTDVLEAVRRFSPKLVLLDRATALLDAKQLLRLVGDRVKILFVSDDLSAELPEVVASVAGFIKRGTDPSELVASLNRVLRPAT